MLLDWFIRKYGLKRNLRLLVAHRMSMPFLSRKNRSVFVGFFVIVLFLSSLGIIAASLWTSNIISSRGNIKVDRVGVYTDGNCTIAVKNLDWGTLEPGSAQNISLYVRNEGNHAATLFITAGNWNPTNASSYMSLSWNYDGTMLDPMATVDVTLTLSVSQNVENIVDFSFDVIIGING